MERDVFVAAAVALTVGLTFGWSARSWRAEQERLAPSRPIGIADLDRHDLAQLDADRQRELTSAASSLREAIGRLDGLLTEMTTRYSNAGYFYKESPSTLAELVISQALKSLQTASQQLSLSQPP